MASHGQHARGFTLLEMLVVVAVITILAGLIFVVVKSARLSANRATCASNLHQISVAIQAYAADNLGEIPAVYGLSYSHGRPMAWCNVGMHKDGIACGGLLLLVNRPEGLADGDYLPNISLYHCPGDSVWHGHEAISYQYCYVPRGGGTYSPWYLQPPKIDPSKYGWNDGVLAGLERHNVATPNPASTALLIEVTALHRKGPTSQPWIKFHGAGGNVLYFDGHVQNVDLDLPFPHQLRQYLENTFSNVDKGG